VGNRRGNKQVILDVSFRLPVSCSPGEKHIIASCPCLGVSTQGETEKKALKNLEEALGLFITSCFERGVLDEVLRDSGFEPVIDKAPSKRGKKTTSCEVVNIRVPLGSRRVACHA